MQHNSLLSSADLSMTSVSITLGLPMQTHILTHTMYACSTSHLLFSSLVQMNAQALIRTSIYELNVLPLVLPGVKMCAQRNVFTYRTTIKHT